MLEDLDNLKKDFQEYFSVQFDLIRLRTAENISRIASKSANIMVISYLMFFILLFGSVAAGFYISSRLDSDVLGFLYVTAFYILLLIIFLIFRKIIIDRPVIKSIVKIFFSENDNEKK
jgi:hypothetical protein